MTNHGRRPAPQPKTVRILESEYKKVSEELHTLRKECASKQTIILSQNQRIGELEVKIGKQRESYDVSKDEWDAYKRRMEDRMDKLIATIHRVASGLPFVYGK